LLICVIFFSISTMIGYSYYGCKCAAHLFGDRARSYYNAAYLAAIVLAALASLDLVVNFVDSMFALMAIPTMTATLLLSPRVMRAARAYFSRLKEGST